MNSKIKTYASIPLLFLFVALLWSLIGNNFILNKKENLISEKKSLIKKMTTNLMVKDVNESLKFYKDDLMFNLQYAYPDSANPQFVILGLNNIELMLQNLDSARINMEEYVPESVYPTASLYYEVEDIKQFFDILKNKYTIIKDLHKTFYGAEEFYILDPDGYIIGFAEQNK